MNDKTLDDFSRQEAAELIPKSNPFLRKLFADVAGPDIDERIMRTVDNLAEVFRATNVEQLLRNFGKSTQKNDPIIHFYETFLAEYDPKLRKARGVWYTPEPVVNFIVRVVDDILRTEFDLPQGIADTSKTKIEVPIEGSKKKQEKEVHKVQILDPATGTGTFLAEVVKHIYNKRFKAMQGAWSSYVDEHLIPRLNGFELLMASYAMAHLKLDMLLRDTGYKTTKNQRFNIYLTNSLEPYHPTESLFADWLSTEAKEANYIKHYTPVMVVIGNPPYSVSSSNKSKWIKELIKDYKENLNEKKINLDDDYIKFIRYGEYLINKTGEGILAYISNNSFIDGITHRRMREHLLETFDKIYILDLHGNSKKKETAPDGGKDENVFDIMQGVSINIFVKKTKSKKLAQVFHYDLYGKRQTKYYFLNETAFNSINWNELEYKKPYYFFVSKDFEAENNYKKGFKIDEIFKIFSSGIETQKDSLVIQFTENELERVKQDILNNEEKVRNEYKIKDTRDWKLASAKEDLKSVKNIDIAYRPFDIRKTFYSGNSKGIMAYPRHEVMKHMLKENYALQITGKNRQLSLGYFFIIKIISDRHLLDSAADSMKSFPLYLYPNQETDGIFADENLTKKSRKPNLNMEIVNHIAEKLGLQFTPEKDTSTSSASEGTFAPIDILDYIYAVLHSPTYRKKYKEFLKIDFPRVPYPKNKETFWQLVKIGSELRQIHLLESPKVEEFITSYPIDGDNTITTKIGKKDWEITNEEKQLGRIWINEKQYFENIPLVAWEFYIGGYQPAQKWLKDRRGRTLSFEDILHYQKIIVALTETDRLMKEIDKIKVE